MLDLDLGEAGRACVRVRNLAARERESDEEKNKLLEPIGVTQRSGGRHRGQHPHLLLLLLLFRPVHPQKAPHILPVPQHAPHAPLRERTHPPVPAVGERHARARDDVVYRVVRVAGEGEAEVGESARGHVEVLAGDVAQEGHVGGGQRDVGLGGGGEVVCVYGMRRVGVPVDVPTASEVSSR